MKISIFILSAAVLIAACNSNPKVTPTATNIIVVPEQKPSIIKQQEATASPATIKKTTTQNAPATDATINSSDAQSSESTNAAKAKKGWSKTAKGAVIGGVVGAGTGAIADKHHRVVGAVIGGAAGAGAGAIIGNVMDKKDGRH
jgi:hypothetical protein